MKPINSLLAMLFVSLLSSPSWSETLSDLVFRDGLYFKKFTDVPFTGKLTGNPQGSFKNGQREGAWVHYYENGQLEYKGNYKNGYQENTWISYYENGQLYYKGNFKNGWLEGAWVWYYDDGQVNNKGNYKKGKRDGAWVYYREDGTVSKLMTGTFKGGVKISD